jgi:hypothetical protein
VKNFARTPRNGSADELAALWAEYGDTEVAEWDEAAGMPRARPEAVN